MKAGTRVRIATKFETTPELLWADEMNETIGKVGEVTKTDQYGYVDVKFTDEHGVETVWTYVPNVLEQIETPETTKKQKAIIKATKVVENGERLWRIEKLCGFLERYKLPEEYLSGLPNMDSEVNLFVPQGALKYLNCGEHGNRMIKVRIGNMYTDNQIREIVKWMKICGQRLSKINKQAKHDGECAGTETIVI